MGYSRAKCVLLVDYYYPVRPQSTKLTLKFEILTKHVICAEQILKHLFPIFFSHLTKLDFLSFFSLFALKAICQREGFQQHHCIETCAQLTLHRGGLISV